jgi:signal transduction histidine kinase
MDAARRGRSVLLGVEAVLALFAGVGTFTASAALVAAPLPHVPIVILYVLCTLLVLAVARFWGIAYAVPVGVASAVSLDWYSIPPTHTSVVPGAEDAVALAVYLLTGVLLGELAVHARRRADVAETARSALADEQAALRRVATMVASGTPPAEVFATVTAEVEKLLRTDVTSMLRYETDGSATVVAAQSLPDIHIPVGTRLRVEGENVAAMVLRTERPARLDSNANATGDLAELLRELGVRSSAGSPIVADGRLWGVMVAASVHHEPLPEDTELRIGEFTQLVATAISNTATRAELAASRARVVATGDETRRRLQRDLHDGAQQRLVSLALDVRAAEAMAPRELGELQTQLSQIREGLTSALDELREISQGIHPAILSEGGLLAAMKSLARRSAIPVELDIRGNGQLSEQVKVAAFYIVSEALTNAAKHAQATVVHVDFETKDVIARLSISDDGVGGADPERGSGLVGLKDRVEALSGRIEISSPSGGGTSLRVTIPIQRV